MIEFKEEVLKNVAVHCDEEWKANNLLEWADSKGHNWCNGEYYTDNNTWYMYCENTVYLLYNGSYTSLPSCKGDNGVESILTILSYEDALLKEEKAIMKKGDWVYVSGASEESARMHKIKRILLANVGGKSPFICVSEDNQDCYPNGAYRSVDWKYAVPIPEEDTIPEMTMEEVVEKVGYNFKLVK